MLTLAMKLRHSQFSLKYQHVLYPVPMYNTHWYQMYLWSIDQYLFREIIDRCISDTAPTLWETSQATCLRASCWENSLLPNLFRLKKPSCTTFFDLKKPLVQPFSSSCCEKSWNDVNNILPDSLFEQKQNRLKKGIYFVHAHYIPYILS